MDNQKNIYKKGLPIVILLMVTTNIFAQKVVRYDLYVKDTIVNFPGKDKRAIAVNGQIPMPTLTFTEGDTAEIHVHNKLKESTSLHWHGLFLPDEWILLYQKGYEWI
ncbi:MAG TPA: multicopper oxidase domain-containing protein [Saprospiraceae bacterium]|nr:multicopper oxidase domain-containing protein [Saprospiraceae bacterium]